MAIVAITASSGVEEFFNRNHSKSNGRFSSGSGGSGSASGTGTSKTSSPGTATKISVKNDWHNANHALNEKITPKIERKVATTVKAAKSLAAKYPDKQGGPSREKFGKATKK